MRSSSIAGVIKTHLGEKCEQGGGVLIFELRVVQQCNHEGEVEDFEGVSYIELR